MTIASSQIVYCVAQPGTGKTFTGDYLDVIHGYYHVDGDIPLRTGYLPKTREILKGLVEFHIRTGIEGSGGGMYVSETPEMFATYEKYVGGYYQLMVDSALEAAKTNDRVVITFADGCRYSRDYVMEKLKEGGAANVTLMYLTMDMEKKLEALYYRSKRQAEVGGISFADSMKMDPEWKGDGEEVSMEEYKAFMKQPGRLGAPSKFHEAPPLAKVVDVTDRDVTVIDAVDAALGLQRSGDEPYDEIVERVVARDRLRDEETPYTYEVFPGIVEEVEEALKNAKTDEEKATIKRRASSIVKLEVMTRGLSQLSVASDDEPKNRRRSSLIKTGSCKNVV